MDTADHAEARRRRLRVRLAIVAAVGVAAGVVALSGIVMIDSPSIEEQLTVRAVQVLEQAPASGQTDHSGHGQVADPSRRVDIDGNELRCVAKAFGYDPPNAATVNDVRTIYAHHMCAAVGPGLAWPASIRETGPVALRLDDQEPIVLPDQALPDASDAPYADRVRAIIPERYHQQALAFGNFVDPDVAEELRDRIDS